MSRTEKNHLAHLIINIILATLLIIASILIFVQAIINIKYNNSKNKKILTEKLVYEQFSHDVYSNINSKILYDFEVYPFSKDCPDDKEPVLFSIKLDSYYDCEGVDASNIDESICLDRITNSLLCCQKSCCQSNGCRNKDPNHMENEEKDDERKDKCVFFNKYNGKFTQITNGVKICAKKYDYDYQYFLYLSEKDNIKSDECIYLDSSNHCINSGNIIGNLKLKLSNNSFLLNNKNVIVKNIFSEIIPNYFEYELLLKEWILNNQIKISDTDQEDVNKYNEIDLKNLYDTFFENIDDSFKGGNIYYDKQKEFLINEIISNNNEPVFENYLNDDYIKKKSVNWYSRNYIGFKNIDELNKFKEIFDENDVTNNPLYKINNDILYPNIESIIIISIFLAEFITSIIIEIKSFCDKNSVKIKPYLVIDSVTQICSVCLLIIYFFIYLFKYIYKYKKIEIDMEIYYRFVLEQYNKRRSQSYLLLGVIILFITLILIFINYIIMIRIYDTKGINSTSGNSIICTLRNTDNSEEHQFKFYLNRKFSTEMERFKEKYFKNYDIEKFNFKRKRVGENIEREIIIDEEQKVWEIGLQNNSIINVVCERK